MRCNDKTQIDPVWILNAFKEGDAEVVQLGSPDLRYDYIDEDGNKGTFGSVRTVRRVINEARTGSEKFVVGISTFQPGQGGPVHVHDNAEEYSYIISGEGVQLDKENRIVGHYKAGDIKFVPKGTYHGGFCVGNEPMVMLFCYSAGGVLPTK